MESTKPREQAKILSLFELLEEKGPILPRPYADILDDGIHELRVKLSGKQIRILYFFCYRDFIVLTHAFQKKTTRVPKAELNKAKKYRDDFLYRADKSDPKELKNENI